MSDEISASDHDPSRALALYGMTLGFKARSGRVGLRDRLGLAERALAWGFDREDLRRAVSRFLRAVQIDGSQAEAGAVFLADLDRIMDDLGILRTEAALKDAGALPEPQLRSAERPDGDGMFGWQRRTGAGFGE